MLTPSHLFATFSMLVLMAWLKNTPAPPGFILMNTRVSVTGQLTLRELTAKAVSSLLYYAAVTHDVKIVTNSRWNLLFYKYIFQTMKKL